MRRLLGILISSLLVFLPLSEASAATPKAGAKCKKAGSVVVSKGREFTCIKQKKKLIWSKGVQIQVLPGVTASPTPTSVVTPTPTPSPTPTVREFTAAEVAQRNTPSNCWTIINSNVYDLTQWINSHPGGPGVIRQLCGTDGTTSFGGQHGNQTAPMRELNRFYLGKLKS